MPGSAGKKGSCVLRSCVLCQGAGGPLNGRGLLRRFLDDFVDEAVFLGLAGVEVLVAFAVFADAFFGLTGVAVSGVVIELVMLTVAIVEVRRRIRQHMTGVI